MKRKDALKINQLCANFMPNMVNLACQHWTCGEKYDNRAHESIVMLSRYMMLAYTKGIEKFSDSELFYMALYMKQVNSLMEELNEQYKKNYDDPELFMGEFLLLGGALESMLDILGDDAEESGSRLLMRKDSEEFNLEEFLSKFDLTSERSMNSIPTKKLVNIFNELGTVPAESGYFTEVNNYYDAVTNELDRRGVKTHDKNGDLLEKIDVGYNID